MKLTSNTINLNQLNVYTFISFFLISISFFLIKSFFGEGEISDNLFIISCFLLFEIGFLILINNYVNFKIESRIDFLIYSLIFFLIFFIWSDKIAKSSTYFLSFILLQTFLAVLIFFKDFKFLKIKGNFFYTFFPFLLISFLCSGLFYQINIFNYDQLIKIILISCIYFIFYKIIKKKFSILQLIFSTIIFLILMKVFLLSPEKDSFHYSWYLGPAYSSLVDNELLYETVSQYGYLSILLIKYFSVFTKLDLNLSLVILIISFFIIFFALFINLILKTIKYPLLLLVLFACSLIFANVGISNLSGSMFIPSSSVYRFLPSLLTIFLLSNLIKNNNEKFYLNSIFFSIFFLISLLWSFESFFFIFFSIFSLVFSSILYFLFFTDELDKFLFKQKSKNIFFLFIIFLPILIISFIVYDKEINFFYEYVLNFKTTLSKDIVNSRITLLFLSFIFLIFLIFRSSFYKNNKVNFIYNSLWFGLFISFTSYFVVRSHPNNVFNLLPFFIFFVLIFRISSDSVKIYRSIFLEIFIAFTIISSILSFYSDKEIFSKNLLSNELIKKPRYEYKNYIPTIEIKDKLTLYNYAPVTLISGPTIHHYNRNLNSAGFGLPILPLEQFNHLSFERKNFLFQRFFEKNNTHLILCLIECTFYNEKKRMISWDSVYVPEKFIITKIIEAKNNNFNEKLYLLKSN